jgi:hypothetical protein
MYFVAPHDEANPLSATADKQAVHPDLINALLFIPKVILKILKALPYLQR